MILVMMYYIKVLGRLSAAMNIAHLGEICVTTSAYKKLPLAALVMSIVCLPGNAAKALAALAFLVVFMMSKEK